MSTTVHVSDLSQDGPPPTTAGATGDNDAKKQPPTFSGTHFLRTTWRRLSAAVAILFVGLAIALYLHIALSRWTREVVKALFTRRAQGLEGSLQSQLDSFEVGSVAPAPKMRVSQG